MTSKTVGCPKRMRSPGINGEGELRGQPANPGSPGKMAVCVCVCVVLTMEFLPSGPRRHRCSREPETGLNYKEIIRGLLFNILFPTDKNNRGS